MDKISMPPEYGPRISLRSIGVKLIVVCGLSVLMTVPGLYVGGLIEERTNRAAEVVRQISGYSGGKQTFLGPTLVIPYKAQPPAGKVPSQDAYVVFPGEASAVNAAGGSRR